MYSSLDVTSSRDKQISVANKAKLDPRRSLESFKTLKQQQSRFSCQPDSASPPAVKQYTRKWHVLSQFDPTRKQKLKIKKVKTRVNFDTLNQVSLSQPGNRATYQVSQNFRHLCEQNQLELEQKTQLTRSELIHVYTTFVAMFMLQECETNYNDQNSHVRVKSLNYTSLLEQSKQLKFQPDLIGQHIMQTLRIKGNGLHQHVKWEEFVDSCSYILPKTMKGKMYLFLRAIAPQNIPEQNFDDYEFSQKEIIQIC